jgi:hypothetical protein
MKDWSTQRMSSLGQVGTRFATFSTVGTRFVASWVSVGTRPGFDVLPKPRRSSALPCASFGRDALCRVLDSTSFLGRGEARPYHMHHLVGTCFAASYSSSLKVEAKLGPTDYNL